MENVSENTPYLKEIMKLFDKNAPAKSITVYKGSSMGATVIHLCGTNCDVHISDEAIRKIDLMIEACN